MEIGWDMMILKVKILEYRSVNWRLNWQTFKVWDTWDIDWYKLEYLSSQDCLRMCFKISSDTELFPRVQTLTYFLPFCFHQQWVLLYCVLYTVLYCTTLFLSLMSANTNQQLPSKKIGRMNQTFPTKTFNFKVYEVGQETGWKSINVGGE